MKIKPIREVGDSRKSSISTTYSNIVSVLGLPNSTDLDDPDKVKASWGFTDSETGRKGFVWCYKVSPNLCTSWSVDGDIELIKELFL